MHVVKELVGDLRSELIEHRRVAIPVGAAVLAVVLAVGAASMLGSELAVAVIAALGMLGAAVAVLVLTARSAGRL